MSKLTADFLFQLFKWHRYISMAREANTTLPLFIQKNLDYARILIKSRPKLSKLPPCGGFLSVCVIKDKVK